MPRVYNEDDQLETVGAEKARLGLVSGAYGTVPNSAYKVRAPDGELGEVDNDKLAQAIDSGFSLVDETTEPSLFKKALGVASTIGPTAAPRQLFQEAQAAWRGEPTAIGSALHGDFGQAANILGARQEAFTAGALTNIPGIQAATAKLAALGGGDEAQRATNDWWDAQLNAPGGEMGKMAGFGAGMAGGFGVGGIVGKAGTLAETGAGALLGASKAAPYVVPAAKLLAEGAAMGGADVANEALIRAGGNADELDHPQLSAQRALATVGGSAVMNLALGSALSGAAKGIGAGVKAAGKYLTPLEGQAAIEADLRHGADMGGNLEGVAELHRDLNASTPAGQKLRADVANAPARLGELATEAHGAVSEMMDSGDGLMFKGTSKARRSMVEQHTPEENASKVVASALDAYDGLIVRSAEMAATPGTTETQALTNKLQQIWRDKRRELVERIPAKLRGALEEPPVHEFNPANGKYEPLASEQARYDASREAWASLSKEEAAKLNGDVFENLNTTKQAASEYAHAAYPSAPYERTHPGAKLMSSLIDEHLTGTLTDADVWGQKAARSYAEVNKAASKYITARDAWNQGLATAVARGEKPVQDEAKYFALWRNENRLGGNILDERGENLVKTSGDLERAIAKHYNVADPVMAKNSAILQNSMAEGAKLLEATRISKEMNTRLAGVGNLEGRALPRRTFGMAEGFGAGAGTGATLGALIAGPVGAAVLGAAGGLVGGVGGGALGMWREAYTNPVRAAQFRGSIEARADLYAKDIAAGSKNAFKKWASGFSPEVRASRGATGSDLELNPIRQEQKRVAAGIEKMGASIAKANPRIISALGTRALRDKFIGAATVVERANANIAGTPHALNTTLGNGLDTAPQTAAALDAGLKSVVTYLNSKLPVQAAPALGQTTRIDAGVSKDDAEKFLRTFEAATNPASVIHDLAKGHVSREAVETVRALYPDLYTEMQDGITRHVESLKEPLPYKAQVLLGNLFGLDTAATNTPEFTARMQGAFMSDNQPQDGNGPGRGATRSTPSRTAEMTATPSQKLAVS